jgi:Ni/Fe-hydrogenase subunit HybB-like protein
MKEEYYLVIVASFVAIAFLIVLVLIAIYSIKQEKEDETYWREELKNDDVNRILNKTKE